MNVSVVICAYTLDRWEDLSSAVTSALRQTIAPCEVIVVIDYNDELFTRASNAMPDAIVVANVATKGLSGARNTGVATSSGEIIAFLDDDAYGEPEWLERLVAPLDDEQIAGAGGWVVPQWPGDEPLWFPKTFLWVLGCSYLGLPEDGATIRNPIGASMAIRRRVFDVAGGFADGIGRVGRNQLGCEETELCIRYIKLRPQERFVLSRDSVVHHRVTSSRLTWHYFWRRCWSEGLSKAAISTLVGSKRALSSERQHLAKALPLELYESMSSLFRDPRLAVRKLWHILSGSLLAATGLLWGKKLLRNRPIRANAWNSGVVVSTHSFTAERAILKVSNGKERDSIGHESGDDAQRDAARIVQFDLDDYEINFGSDLQADERLWVEVVKDGHIVGVAEQRADAGGFLVPSVSQLLAKFNEAQSLSRPAVADSDLLRASVVVPTIYRRVEELRRTVDSLLQLNYPDFEILVIDNRAGVDYEPITDFQDEPRVRVIRESKRGISQARNRGIVSATGEFVAFTDDDVVVDPEWLRAMGELFVIEPEISAVSGLTMPLEFETVPQLWFEEYYGGFSRSFRPEVMSLDLNRDDALFPYAPGRLGAGCNMAFRKATLLELGGFNVCLGTGTPAKGGEDLAMFTSVVFANRAIAFEPTALVRHGHRRTEQEFFMQVMNYGTGLTAMFTSLFIADPRHVLALLRRLPAGLRLLTRPRGERSPIQSPSYPRRTMAYQIMGMSYGPVAYLLSVARSLRR